MSDVNWRIDSNTVDIIKGERPNEDTLNKIQELVSNRTEIPT